MPELPEVETIRRGLAPKVFGRLIAGIELGTHRGFLFDSDEFVETVTGQTIGELPRRGKYLVFELSESYCVFHLGMTGQLTLWNPDCADVPFERTITGLEKTPQHSVDKHTHLQFLLDDGNAVFFRDVRRFGKVQLVPKAEGNLKALFSHLGLEPFTDDYDLEDFLILMRGRKTRVKSLLLNQGFVAGVGNIYADEALFAAGIHPVRRTHRLRLYEKQALFETIPRVLEKGIAYGGTTIRDFLQSDGESGEHQEKLQVYGREGEPCRRCSTPIRKTVISQRGTHFCPRCQPRSGPARRSSL